MVCRPHNDHSSSSSSSSKCSLNHSTSSAFCASAHPDEDWTKISDLAERRRIQNRIAQRNYRKKLKRKLEDLELRSQSKSASPEQKHEDFVARTTIPHQRRRSQNLQEPQRNSNAERRLSPEVPQSQYYYQNGHWAAPPRQQARPLPPSPQPAYYSSWPPQEYLTYPSSSQHHTAYSMSAFPSTPSTTGVYHDTVTTTLSTTLPSMVFPEKDDFYAEADGNAFGIRLEAGSTTDPMYLHASQDPNSNVTLPPIYRYRPHHNPSFSTDT